MPFWSNKPVDINHQFNSSYILNYDVLLDYVTKEISNSNIKLDYYTIQYPNQKLKLELLQFINTNYNSKNDLMTLEYSEELFSYYLSQNTLCILFYPKGKKPKTITTKTMIGFVCAKPQTLCIKDSISIDNFKIYNSIDVNYLCVLEQLRNMNLSGYIINIMTKECLTHFDQKILCAAYTVSKKLPVKSYSTKTFYHRPLNIENLITSDILQNNNDIHIMKKLWNSFSYHNNFLDNCNCKMFYLQSITEDKLEYYVDQLYDKLNQYNKVNYDIFDEKSKKDIKQILTNKSFYKFLTINKTTGDIEDFVCLYNLNVKNSKTHHLSRNGYFYIFMTLKNKNNDYKYDLIEYISEFCYKHNLFDMLILLNLIENFDKHKREKLLNSSCELNYYLYNIKLPTIEPYKNGLVTI